MTDPHTRPGELARIRSIADGDEFRIEVLTSLAVLKDQMERIDKRGEASSKWQYDHEKKDDIRSIKIDERLERIENNQPIITSGINDYREDKQQLKGAKRLALFALSIAVSIGALITWLISILHEIRGNP